MNVLVIGGGPSGMMAAISSAEEGNDVTILEKMNSCGKKLLITGKGRCNITNSVNIEEFYKNILGNPKFLYSAFNCFNNKDMVKFLNKEGLKTKIERGGRIFPFSDKSQDVLNTLLKKLKKLNVKILTNSRVVDILTRVKENGTYIATGVKLENNKKIIADKIILATGGASYRDNRINR